jgi:Spy/CpxP family protein refolding chaperone
MGTVPACARLLVLTALLAVAVPAVGQAPAAAAAPAAHGAAKSLPPDEVASLLAGEGMGLARAAEMNHYPGPRHLLDVENEIGLSEQQRAAIRRIYIETIDNARKVGRKVVGAEAELSEAFVRGAITEARLRSLVMKVSELRGQLRLIHLAAHLKTKKLLTAEQVEKYETLRGYNQD